MNLELHKFSKDPNIIDAIETRSRAGGEIDGADLECEFTHGAETISLDKADIAVLAASIDLTIEDIAQAKIYLATLKDD